MGDRDMVSEHLPMLYRMAWMLTGNEADAQDLAHDAMVSALTSLSRFRGKSRLSTWLSAILINRHRSSRRAEATRVAAARNPRLRQPLADPPDHHLAAKEERKTLLRALDRLGEDERLLIALSFYQDLDSTQIGALLGRPPGTVRYQLHEVREKLRESFLERMSHDD